MTTNDPAYREPSRRPPMTKAACLFCAQEGTAERPCLSCLVKVPNPEAPVTLTFSTCQRCGGHLLAIAIDPSNAVVHCCDRCHGMFVPPQAWCTMIEVPQLATDVEAKLPPLASVAQRPPTLELIKCPACPTQGGGRSMERGRFAASSNIVIDVCESHGLWLDAGELGAVISHASKRAQAPRNNTGLGNWPPQTNIAQQIVIRSQISAEHTSRVSVITSLKAAFGVLALLFFMIEAYTVLMSPRSPIQNKGAETTKAAQGASTALGP